MAAAASSSPGSIGPNARLRRWLHRYLREYQRRLAGLRIHADSRRRREAIAAPIGALAGAQVEPVAVPGAAQNAVFSLASVERPEPVRADRAVRDDLAAWQRLNVCAFMISGITAAAGPAAIGEDYLDADGNRYLPLLVQPVLTSKPAPTN